MPKPIKINSKEDTMLHLKGLISAKAEKNDDGVIDSIIASQEILDRQQEVVKLEGMDIKNFKKNPVILWAHNAHLGEDRPPIGKALKVWTENKKLMIKVQFDMADKFAADIFRKIKEGFLNAVSIGFISVSREDNMHMETELLEVSVVPVPANPKALVQIRSMHTPDGKSVEPVDWDGFFAKEVKKTKAVIDKKVVPFAETSKTDESHGWDAGDAKKRIAEWAGGPDKDKINWSQYRKGFAWFDDEKAETMGSYKLPHHDIVNNELTTIWRGVAAAMAALLGARGGTDIPEADKQAVYDHLKKHYEQYGKDVPEYRHVEEQTLKKLNVEITEAFATEALHQLKKVKMDLGKVKGLVKQKVVRTKLTAENLSQEDLVESLKILNQATNIALQKVKELRGGEKK